ncbi:MAG TPA: hypothetical protein VFF03_18845 [Rhodocyclaceae bacterium]|nr:hypothetical protein [Rhodocyclaceae bacterium]
MSYRYKLLAIPLLALLGGCSVLQGGKLYAPESFGLIPVAPNLYVEPGTDEATQTRLIAEMATAERVIRAAYGDAKAHPVVHACITETCLESFGGKGTLAKVYGNRILLSPRGLRWQLIVHEWSHAELSKRLSLSAWKRMPQWFDEGVAVALSDAPEHSEAHWQYLVANNVSRPTREELLSFKTLSQWNDAVHRFGDGRNAERRARGEPEIHSLYAAAGHELRPWLASGGLLALIDRLNAGEEFDGVYRSLAKP